MSRQSERLPSRGQKLEKVYFLLRWPVIVVAFLFVWPLGVILLITKIIGAVRKNRQEKVLQDNKIPFAKSKSKEDKQAYAAHCSQQKKRLITSFLMTALFLLLGCWGMTRDYLQLFWGSGFTGKTGRRFSQPRDLFVGGHLPCRQSLRPAGAAAAFGAATDPDRQCRCRTSGPAAGAVR